MEFKSYCHFTRNLPADNLHKIYHDTAYGFPLESDNELFGRLLLEINQAGLSWETILKKQEGIKAAYADFDIDQVANFTETDRERILSNPEVIRNKLKVNSAIYNAQQIVGLQKEFGSFKNWLDHHHPKTKDQWVKLFKKTFKFTGGEITNEFLLSTGYLKGAHEEDCPIYKEVLRHNPPWSRIGA